MSQNQNQQPSMTHEDQTYPSDVMAWFEALQSGQDVPDKGESFGTGVGEYQRGGTAGVNADRDADPDFWGSHTRGNQQTRDALGQALEDRQQH